MVAPARATVTIFLVVKGRGVEGQKTSFLVGSVGGGEEVEQYQPGPRSDFFSELLSQKKWLEGKEGRYNDWITDLLYPPRPSIPQWIPIFPCAVSTAESIVRREIDRIIDGDITLPPQVNLRSGAKDRFQAMDCSAVSMKSER